MQSSLPGSGAGGGGGGGGSSDTTASLEALRCEVSLLENRLATMAAVPYVRADLSLRLLEVLLSLARAFEAARCFPEATRALHHGLELCEDAAQPWFALPESKRWRWAVELRSALADVSLLQGKGAAAQAALSSAVEGCLARSAFLRTQGAPAQACGEPSQAALSILERKAALPDRRPSSADRDRRKELAATRHTLRSAPPGGAGMHIGDMAPPPTARFNLSAPPPPMVPRPPPAQPPARGGNGRHVAAAAAAAAQPPPHVREAAAAAVQRAWRMFRSRRARAGLHGEYRRYRATRAAWEAAQLQRQLLELGLRRPSFLRSSCCGGGGGGDDDGFDSGSASLGGSCGDSDNATTPTPAPPAQQRRQHRPSPPSRGQQAQRRGPASGLLLPTRRQAALRIQTAWRVRAAALQLSALRLRYYHALALQHEEEGRGRRPRQTAAAAAAAGPEDDAVFFCDARRSSAALVLQLFLRCCAAAGRAGAARAALREAWTEREGRERHASASASSVAAAAAAAAAALRIQRAWRAAAARGERGLRARALEAAASARAAAERRAGPAATEIQRCWRGLVGRRTRVERRAAYRERRHAAVRGERLLRPTPGALWTRVQRAWRAKAARGAVQRRRGTYRSYVAVKNKQEASAAAAADEASAVAQHEERVRSRREQEDGPPPPPPPAAAAGAAASEAAAAVQRAWRAHAARRLGGGRAARYREETRLRAAWEGARVADGCGGDGGARQLAEERCARAPRWHSGAPDDAWEARLWTSLQQGRITLRAYLEEMRRVLGSFTDGGVPRTPSPLTPPPSSQQQQQPPPSGGGKRGIRCLSAECVAAGSGVPPSWVVAAGTPAWGCAAPVWDVGGGDGDAAFGASLDGSEVWKCACRDAVAVSKKRFVVAAGGGGGGCAVRWTLVARREGAAAEGSSAAAVSAAAAAASDTFVGVVPCGEQAGRFGLLYRARDGTLARQGSLRPFARAAPSRAGDAVSLAVDAEAGVELSVNGSVCWRRTPAELREAGVDGLEGPLLACAVFHGAPGTTGVRLLAPDGQRGEAGAVAVQRAYRASRARRLVQARRHVYASYVRNLHSWEWGQAHGTGGGGGGGGVPPATARGVQK